MHQLTDKKNKVLIYVIFLLILSTTSEKNTENKKNKSFKVHEINVVGLSSGKNSQILKELNNFFYQNIFFLDKEEITKTISKHNIIEKYSIRKIYPSKLDIYITPTKYIARISEDNRLFVGANGKLILKTTNDIISIPYIFGEFNSKKFLEFKKNITESNFSFDDLKIIYFFPSNRLDVLTIDNILIKLPEKNLFQSLNLAHKIIINDQFKDKKIIDLRVGNHLVVK